MADTTQRIGPPPFPPVPLTETNIAFPLSVTALGRTATASDTDHIRQLIRQVLFTSPGERVNRPTFGCGLEGMVFATRRNELAIAAETTVQGTLQRWLGDLISVENVAIVLEDNSITVDLRYTENRSRQSWFVRFVQE